MAFLIKDTIDVIRSDLMKTNYFTSVDLGEPKSAPVTDTKMSLHIWMESIACVAVTGNGTIEVYTLTARIMTGLFQEPVALIETQLEEAVAKSAEALFANFTADAKVRNIDAAGQYGTAYRVDWGHFDIGGKLFRGADITLPLVVDDSATFTA